MKQGIVWTIAGLLLFTACADSKVEITAPTPDNQAREICAHFLGRVPMKVADKSKRDVNGDSALTAAWGNPAITLRCGVSEPANMTPASQLVSVNEIDWFPQELSAGWRFTSTNTSVRVEVSVPKEFQPEANALVDLTTSLRPLIISASAE